MPYPTFLPAIPDIMIPMYGPVTMAPAGVRFLFGGDLLLGGYSVLRSADFGVTWTPADPGAAKLGILAAVKDANFPAVPKVYVVWLDGIFPGPYTFTLSTFNTVTELWEADIPSVLVDTVSGAGLGESYKHLAHRAADNKVILWTAPVVEVVAGNDRRRCQIAFCDLAGAAWSAYTQVGTPGGDDADYLAHGCVSGAGGLTHLFLVQDNLPLLPLLRTRNLIHVSLTAADVLSANQVMQAFDPDDCQCQPIAGVINGAGNSEYVTPISRVVGANTEILYPYVTETTLLLGADFDWNLNVAKALSAIIPVWAINSIETTVRPFQEMAPGLYQGFNLVNDTGDIVNAFWGRRSTAGEDDRIDISTSPDGLAWAIPALFYDIPAGTGYGGIGIVNLGVQRVGSRGMFVALGNLVAFPVAYWDVPPAPVAVLPSPDFYRRGKPQIKCANVWDWCLGNDENLWRAVDWRKKGVLNQCRSAGLVSPDGLPLSLDNPLHALPEQGREFHKFGAISLPAPSTDTRILQFTVPTGYDGIVYAVLFKFTGLGFVNGSGDLMWRVRMNRHWIKSLQAVPTEMGDYTAYAQIEEYIWIHGGQTIGVYGWVSPAAMLVPGPDTRMIAALQGWYFPAGLVE